ncbi:MAG: hypothetical protein IT371_30840 [Deltaproteobacteria bacterium]|nr:hypothetical protein [Deltaproteobacteria bacterium]
MGAWVGFRTNNTETTWLSSNSTSNSTATDSIVYYAEHSACNYTDGGGASAPPPDKHGARHPRAVVFPKRRDRAPGGARRAAFFSRGSFRGAL